MTSPMFMCFVLFVIWHSTLMICDNGVFLYWASMTFYMSFGMLLLFHDSHDGVKRQQDLLLLWFLLGEFGLSILHGGDGVW